MSKEQNKDDSKSWEQELITKLLLSSEDTNKKILRLNRVTVSLRVLTFVIFAAILSYSVFGSNTKESKKVPHTAYIDITGEISKGSPNDADSVIRSLRKAFDNEYSKAVVVRINSPGGSPVQSNQIYQEIRRLKESHDKKVYAVIDDIGASGGYFIAAAADEIYADASSIVGSIGVISASFGFSDLMEKLGVERRVFISGNNKSMLDPYSPITKEAEEQWQSILNSTHKMFISRVKEGRGDRLDTTNELLFSGFVWSGEQAAKIGLIDGYGGLSYVSSEIVGESETVSYTPKRSFFSSLSQRVAAQLGAATQLGAGVNLR